MSLLASEVREGKVNPFVYILVSAVVHLPIICVTSVTSSKSMAIGAHVRYLESVMRPAVSYATRI